MKLPAVCIAVLSLTVMVTPALPWGCEGHQIIALVAGKHLNPHARRMVNDLLTHYTVGSHVKRLCRSAGLDAMADLSTWADDVRNSAGSPYHGTGPWHFIDIPRPASRGDLHRFCPKRGGCLISALDDQLIVLDTGAAPRSRMAEALLFVIHLVGDLHQPLHCATNNDLGGNCVPVTYLGIEPRQSRQHRGSDLYEPNLHAVWDSAILERIAAQRGAGRLADFLERRFQSQLPLWEREPIDLITWTWESHQVANDMAYGQLPKTIPAEKPKRVTECGQMSERMLALHERLTQRYQQAVAPAVEEQLAKAGIRLAMILNHLWP